MSNSLLRAQSLGYLLAALISFCVCYSFKSVDDGGGMILSAMLGLYVMDALLPRYKWRVLAGMSLMVAASAFISAALSSHVMMLAFFLLLTTFVTVWVGQRYVYLWTASFVVNLYAVLSAGWPGDLSVERPVTLLVGFGIAGLIQLLLLQGRKAHQVRAALVNCLDTLGKLNTSIFSLYLFRDYRVAPYQYEIDLHECRRQFLLAITGFRQQIRKTDNEEYHRLLSELERLYEILLALGLLVHRINDHTTFEVAYNEFNALTDNVRAQLIAAKATLLRKKESVMVSLKEPIESFAAVNRNALHIVAEQPLLFSLFIHDLMALDEALSELSVNISLLISKKEL